MSILLIQKLTRSTQISSNILYTCSNYVLPMQRLCGYLPTVVKFPAISAYFGQIAGIIYLPKCEDTKAFSKALIQKAMKMGASLRFKPGENELLRYDTEFPLSSALYLNSNNKQHRK